MHLLTIVNLLLGLEHQGPSLSPFSLFAVQKRHLVSDYITNSTGFVKTHAFRDSPLLEVSLYVTQQNVNVACMLRQKCPGVWATV